MIVWKLRYWAHAQNATSVDMLESASAHKSRYFCILKGIIGTILSEQRLCLNTEWKLASEDTKDRFSKAAM